LGVLLRRFTPVVFRQLGPEVDSQGEVVRKVERPLCNAMIHKIQEG